MKELEWIDGENLLPVTLQSASLFRRILAERPSVSCESSFVNLFIWSDVYGNRFFEFEGRLFVFNKLEQILQFPLGKFLEPEKMLLVAKAFQASGHTIHGYFDVPDEYLLAYPEAADFFKISQSDDFSDYIYSCGQLKDLSGNKLRKKRNLIKQFVEEFPGHQIIEISPETLPLARDLAERLNREHEPCRFIEEENIALARTWEYFNSPELSLGGLILTVEGEAVGFSVFSSLGNGVYDIHFEKADHTCKGAGQLVTQQVAAHLFGRAKLINREQDLGDLGLRQAKHSLDPLVWFRRSELILH